VQRFSIFSPVNDSLAAFLNVGEVQQPGLNVLLVHFVGVHAVGHLLLNLKLTLHVRMIRLGGVKS